MKELSDSREECPLCGGQLQGDPIPEDQQELFGATHFSLKRGVYDLHKDRTTQWQCPHCNGFWDRKEQ